MTGEIENMKDQRLLIRNKIMMVLKDRRAFTLVEALVTVIVFSVILGACYAVLMSGSDSWEANSVRVELQQELRKGMDWILNDLRQAGSASVSDVPANGTWYTSITFRKSNGVSSGVISWAADTTKYLLGGSDSTQLQRQVGSQTPAVIAQNISTLQFRRLASAPNVVEVNLQAQKKTLRGKNMTGKTAITANLSFKVHLRN